jgi:hypothetical protein
MFWEGIMGYVIIGGWDWVLLVPDLHPTGHWFFKGQ